MPPNLTSSPRAGLGSARLSRGFQLGVELNVFSLLSAAPALAPLARLSRSLMDYSLALGYFCSSSEKIMSPFGRKSPRDWGSGMTRLPPLAPCSWLRNLPRLLSPSPGGATTELCHPQAARSLCLCPAPWSPSPPTASSPSLFFPPAASHTPSPCWVGASLLLPLPTAKRPLPWNWALGRR